MKIAICASLSFTDQVAKVAKELENIGFAVEIPISSRKILKGQVTLADIDKLKKQDTAFSEYIIQNDSIRAYWEIIKGSDAILVLNFTKNGVKNYVGPNVFLEIGFAHVLGKPIFLYNNLPDGQFTAEILSMQPIVINKNLARIKNFEREG
ncbi:MAG: hypothetical protein WC858_00225 [Parcubacteria group bacterium]|jgi:hypothetical protein